jgi:medium-chain acyl-[acyl-carrier-protein] hydrolase
VNTPRPQPKRWFVSGTPSPATTPRTRLFCFPFAGGGASVYREWRRDLSSLDVVAVQPPGREDRYGEPAYTSLTHLTRDLAGEIAPLLDRPSVFFGHSMGGAIAYQLAVDLQRAGVPGPQLLILSARPAPHAPPTRAPIHALPDDGFIAELRKLAGTPAAVLDNRELMDFLLPTLRADFELCDTHTCPREAVLSIPFVIFGGVEDATARREALDGWRDYTTGPTQLRMFPGGHFFLQTHKAQVLQAVHDAVSSVAR